MRSPYADIHAAAMRAAFSAPRLATRPADPADEPSPRAKLARDTRIAASLINATGLRLTVQRRGDYPAIVGAPMPEHFTTQR